MRKLFLDIETAPHVAYVWKLYDENIGASQLIQPGRVLCVAYKFDDEPMRFSSEWGEGGAPRMAGDVWTALDEADAVVHYNGVSFDEKHLNRLFLQSALPPPGSYKTIDLYRVVKQRFKFASSRLAQVVEELDIREGKLKTDFSLWSGVLEHDASAQRKMERYCKEDVRLLPELYDALLPWIERHPNVALYGGSVDACTRCGSPNVYKNGVYYTGASTFQRYRCRECGGESRGAKRLDTTNTREVPR